MTLTINREKISEKTICFGKTHLIELHKYYDLDGDKINEGIDTFNYDTAVDFKIVETKYATHFVTGDVNATWWDLYLNGEETPLQADITGYKINGDVLVLSGCTGCG